MDDAFGNVCFSLISYVRYKQRSSVNAVIHAHSQNLMMFVVSSILPIYNHIPYVHNFLGEIAQIPYLLCGSEELVWMLCIMNERHYLADVL